MSVSVCVCDKYTPQEQVLSLAVKKTRGLKKHCPFTLLLYFELLAHTFQKEIFNEHRYRKKLVLSGYLEEIFFFNNKNSGQTKGEEKKTKLLQLRELDSYLSLPLCHIKKHFSHSFKNVNWYLLVIIKTKISKLHSMVEGILS